MMLNHVTHCALGVRCAYAMGYGAMPESAAELLFQVRHWNRSSGRYLHPTAPQTIACRAFYEVAISAKPQHFEFQPLLKPLLANRSGLPYYHRRPGRRPNQGIELGQIELTETLRGTADNYNRRNLT